MDGMDSMDESDSGRGLENFNVFFCRLMCLWMCLPNCGEHRRVGAELAITVTYDGNIDFWGYDRTAKGLHGREIRMCFFVD
jgi:hypothetical protein